MNGKEKSRPGAGTSKAANVKTDYIQNSTDAAVWQEMPGGDRPFSADGMTAGEIEAFYRGAKDKNGAVEILAECNAADKGRMAAFLAARGMIEGACGQKREKKTPERVEQLIALADRGMSRNEIAGELGVSKNYINRLASQHGIRLPGARKTPQSGTKRERPDVSRERPAAQVRGAKAKAPAAAAAGLAKELERAAETFLESAAVCTALHAEGGRIELCVCAGRWTVTLHAEKGEEEA